MSTHDLHDDTTEAAVLSRNTGTAPQEPVAPLDFCAKCRKQNCPKFTPLEGGGVEITDTEYPGMRIELAADEARELTAWLRQHTGG